MIYIYFDFFIDIFFYFYITYIFIISGESSESSQITHRTDGSE